MVVIRSFRRLCASSRQGGSSSAPPVKAPIGIKWRTKTENPNRRKRVGHDAEKKRGVLWLTPFTVVPFRENGLVGPNDAHRYRPSLCRSPSCCSLIEQAKWVNNRGQNPFENENLESFVDRCPPVDLSQVTHRTSVNFPENEDWPMLDGSGSLPLPL
ncbi:uncharacterized protein G2W53_009379 [Senna tora]|uniref:Uncharacterized protein n=1 Tax=Senna tora TaxID=362788 RepID=A0A834WY63_9FABA|nr:uncharacterized protein G2W53_009379 [Senna tora]